MIQLGTYSRPMTWILILAVWTMAIAGTTAAENTRKSSESRFAASARAWTPGEESPDEPDFNVDTPYCRSIWDSPGCTTAATLPQVVMGPLGQNISRTEIVVTNAGPVGRACDLALLFHRGASEAPEALFNGRAADGNFIRTNLPAGGARIFTLTPADPAELVVGAVSVFTRAPCSSDSVDVQGRYLLEHEATGEIDEIFSVAAQRPEEWLSGGDCRVLTGVFGPGRDVGFAVVAGEPGQAAPPGTELRYRSFDLDGNLIGEPGGLPVSGEHQPKFPWDFSEPAIIEMCLQVPEGQSDFRASVIAVGITETANRIQWSDENLVDSLKPYDRIESALVYDHDPETRLGDAIFGDVIVDFENDDPGRNSHGGPVCMQYADGRIVAFHSNASDHNLDGWSEYAVSDDGARSWQRYNKFPYSYDQYLRDPEHPVWVEEGLVTEQGTAVLFLTHFLLDNSRTGSGIMISRDHGSSWTEYAPIDGDFTGYPCAVAVDGPTNYVLFDSNAGHHVLYVSTDDGQTWTRRSTLALDRDKWYGAMCIMEDGRLLAGAYTHRDEYHFYYTISGDQGETWSPQGRAYVDQKIRDPELAYLGGKYYLHGRSGSVGEGRGRFVLYQSDDGINWSDGIIVSSDARHLDGYSHNCLVDRQTGAPKELMVQYSIIYDGRDTNTYGFFIQADPAP